MKIAKLPARSVASEVMRKASGDDQQPLAAKFVAQRAGDQRAIRQPVRAQLFAQPICASLVSWKYR